jgi:hypothetical protein
LQSCWHWLWVGGYFEWFAAPEEPGSHIGERFDLLVGSLF